MQCINSLSLDFFPGYGISTILLSSRGESRDGYTQEAAAGKVCTVQRMTLRDAVFCAEFGL